jgi:hypothetical protein
MTIDRSLCVCLPAVESRLGSPCCGVSCCCCKGTSSSSSSSWGGKDPRAHVKGLKPLIKTFISRSQSIELLPSPRVASFCSSVAPIFLGAHAHPNALLKVNGRRLPELASSLRTCPSSTRSMHPLSIQIASGTTSIDEFDQRTRTGVRGRSSSGLGSSPSIQTPAVDEPLSARAHAQPPERQGPGSTART